MSASVDELMVAPGSTVRDAVACIDRGGLGIALVAGPDRRLFGTVTDGDVRRAMLAGIGQDAPVEELLERQRRVESFPTPLTASADASLEEVLKLMNDHGLRHVPRVDPEGRVVDLVVLDELVRSYEPPLRAVVMAGGLGLRLRPLTEERAKPMLPVGDTPLLERIVGQLRDAGIKRLHVTTHYRGDDIAAHFRDGSDFGVEIHYVNEEQPLGTAGALRLLEQSDEPFLIMNGDIVTELDFNALLRFHRDHDAEMTIAVRPYEVQVPYGVVEIDGVNVTALAEKPVVRHFVNAGIYLIEPELCRYIPENERHDMPELVERLLAEGHRVIGFPVREYWLDIGRPGEYERAQRDAAPGGRA